MRHKLREKPAERVWRDFVEDEQLSDVQLQKFMQYEALLTDWNKRINLTAIKGLSETVSRHFSDSLIVRKFIDLSNVGLVADIGSGAGFPGIPLKIMFPDLGVILIEVSHKKRRFLNTVIEALGLEGIEVCDLDWRTFLRKTESDVEYFLARASLDPLELARMFKPGCVYKHKKIIYWAAEDWVPEKKVQDFVLEEFAYSLKRKKRKLVLMGLSKD